MPSVLSHLSGVLKRGISTTSPRYSGSSSSGSVTMWRNISLFVIIPTVAIMSVVTYREHTAHHCINRPPFIKYDYLRIRNRRFPWGDGTKSFFHNPEVNALPEGYEDDMGGDSEE